MFVCLFAVGGFGYGRGDVGCGMGVRKPGVGRVGEAEAKARGREN